ncbi:MAG: GNAT family N-acetyltransferase [Defluviitaleaceae bacterium]|nr:GNAT family N-acetyltransferase [Defluviitaleaceae bacterium]
MEYKIKKLTPDDLTPNLLQHFTRYQEVKKCWRHENGAWVLKDIPFIDDWDNAKKNEIITIDLPRCMDGGGTVWGVFNVRGHLIAFASLSGVAWGSSGQYLQLIQLHTSREYRGLGIGKALFAVVADHARQCGARKLYISTHSSEESQHFYFRVGCVDAAEINTAITTREPYDRQMEFVL